MTMLSDGMLLGVNGTTQMTFVGSATASVNGGNDVIVNKPAGVQPGDYLVAIVWDTSLLTTVTSTGWTVNSSSFSGNSRYALLVKTAGGSEPTSYTFSSGSVAKSASILAFRNVPGGVQEVGARTTASSATSTTTSISPAQAGILLAFFTIAQAGRTVSTPPGGMTQIAFENANLTSAVYMLAPSPAGATGAKSLVWDASNTVGSFLAQIY